MFQDRDSDLSGGERGVDPHPAVSQQRPTVCLHPVGDELPRSARPGRVHPGRVLEENQRAGNTLIHVDSKRRCRLQSQESF